MHSAIIELDHISLTYHEPHAETLAIDNLSLTINEGEFVSIVGPSGCGKTSMLSLLAGLIKPSSGSVRLLGHEVNRVESNIGYMLQRDHLLDWRTIERNVLLGLEVKHMLNAQTHARALELLHTYGLSDFTKHYPRQLSGGMRQKVALIRTLAFDPSLLLLDEPFCALDYQTRLLVADEVYDIIRKEKKTAILVTHDLAEAISMSDRILVFSERPAHLKSEHIMMLSVSGSPIARRNAAEFKEYFDAIWKELDTCGE